MAAASDPVVIVSAARTPVGRFMGDLSSFSAHKRGSHVSGAALERARLSHERIDEVFMGCVLPAGQGQAPARQAARGAKLPDATGATTINKVCGSGMKATMLAHDIISAGSAEIVVSGGMESMTNAPYLLAKARAGYRTGHDRIIDHMMMDGLEDAYDVRRSMGDLGNATHSQEPQWFATAPIPAIRKLLDKVGWNVGDVDLFEINEAFAVVAMAAQRDLGIPREKLNINGGACALGHPIGATGARLIVTLLHALEAHNLKRGVAALCIGGGEATAIAVERIVH